MTSLYLPCDATQSAFMPQYVVCPPVRLSRSGTVITYYINHIYFKNKCG